MTLIALICSDCKQGAKQSPQRPRRKV